MNDGGVYDPATDTWSNLPSSNSPNARGKATAAWTGEEMIVWGGHGPAGELNTGGRLSMDGQGVPQTWQNISTIGAPTAREDHIAVWTGTRMLVWGGNRQGVHLGDGASYDPISDQWSPISLTNAPSARSRHVGVWTGSELLIWSGGGTAGSLADGTAYNSATDIWRRLVTAGDPVARSRAGAIWSGGDLIVFGGQSSSTAVSSLQRLNPERPWYLYRVVQSAVAPLLKLIVVGEGVELSWPLAASAGFVLEWASNPWPAEAWSPVAAPPVTVGERKVVRLAPVTGVHFFRLLRR